ncbi:hypothetical protein HCH_01485 [Hahella chejuensis KCTC 2396]|uniref:Uncharacterized protein n=1 Tax=Hahella chejuensis (strain KCTC 2396) TaxID=349521 RepID=Q2SLY1_HAHCH|nr:hypothetical protein HCH_01485 [Hahella chejuensis KCTC 2396]
MIFIILPVQPLLPSLFCDFQRPLDGSQSEPNHINLLFLNIF